MVRAVPSQETRLLARLRGQGEVQPALVPLASGATGATGATTGTTCHCHAAVRARISTKAVQTQQQCYRPLPVTLSTGWHCKGGTCITSNCFFVKGGACVSIVVLVSCKTPAVGTAEFKRCLAGTDCASAYSQSRQQHGGACT